MTSNRLGNFLFVSPTYLSITKSQLLFVCLSVCLSIARVG